MYYVKAEIAEGVTIRAEITDENVFNLCPRCGAEVAVDLAEIVTDSGLDLFGTAIYCDKCGAEARDERERCDKHCAVERMPMGHRELNPERWHPDEADKPALVAYFMDYAEVIKGCCGDDWEAEEAQELYKLVKHNPLRYTKVAIQEHFVDAFNAVGGEIEKYYDKSPEVIRLINLTVCPDPLEED